MTNDRKERILEKLAAVNPLAIMRTGAATTRSARSTARASSASGGAAALSKPPTPPPTPPPTTGSPWSRMAGQPYPRVPSGASTGTSSLGGPLKFPFTKDGVTITKDMFETAVKNARSLGLPRGLHTKQPADQLSILHTQHLRAKNLGKA